MFASYLEIRSLGTIILTKLRSQFLYIFIMRPKRRPCHVHGIEWYVSEELTLTHRCQITPVNNNTIEIA